MAGVGLREAPGLWLLGPALAAILRLGARAAGCPCADSALCRPVTAERPFE
ncbi:hypothetical protein chiPu_0024361, partial [Chiloscyllium punctatum]|nr:hypothetical protein [Chiloscyllium punctatum]